ncbi:MAG: ribonuclease H-like domain-containing protein, partial [Lachnospiraceae bacterium]|nr:ribonuclease H-like domain-containing protein [Lachnospiraceae bacterium]
MITRTVELSDPALFYRSCKTAASLFGEVNASDFLFFDIETTGLSPKEACIYLIGCMYESDQGPVLTQLFCDDPCEEPLILDAFRELAERHRIPVHYNGTTFDVPFIRTRAELHRISLPDLNDQLDIYKLLKPLKGLFSLRSMRMKALEEYLGISREDLYDGGQLIEVYIKYISLKKLNSLRSGKCDRSDPVESGSEKTETALFVSGKDESESYLYEQVGIETDLPGQFSPHRPTSSRNLQKQISVFSDYTGLRMIGDFSCNELLQMLLMHNFEDVANMLAFTDLLEFALLMSGCFELKSCDLISPIDTSATASANDDSPTAYTHNPSVTLPVYGTVSTHYAVFTIPVNENIASTVSKRILTPSRLRTGFRATTAGGDIINVTMNVSENEGTYCLNVGLAAADTELKLFFPDYKNYYYLVHEDYAIHKSIGQFMDREKCVKCTSSNCYTRKRGLFLPVFEKKGGALADKVYLYRRSAPDKSLFVLAEDLMK